MNPFDLSNNNVSQADVDTNTDEYNSHTYMTSNMIPNMNKCDNDPIPPRKRTRATPDQLGVLEKTFAVNPSPNSRVREQLSRELGMTERSIQIWFQNRRAKVKNVARKSTMLHDETIRMQYYASSAAVAACKAAIYQQKQKEGVKMNHEEDEEDPIKSNPNMYYYYYYYYYNQQQQQKKYNKNNLFYHPYGQQKNTYQHMFTASSSASIPPPLMNFKSMPPPPPPPPPPSSVLDGPISPSDTFRSDSNTLWSKKEIQQQRTRAHTIGPYYFHNPPNPLINNRGTSVELTLHENFSNLLTSNEMSLSPTFANLSQPQDPLLPYTSPSYLEQQQQQQQQHQLPWTDIPYYEDPSLMITPTTPSIYNPIQPIYYEQENANTQKISAEALQIGSWKRMSFDSNDLLCQYDKDKKTFSWSIQDGLSRFKMDIHQDHVKSIKLTPLSETRPGWARLELELSNIDISFYMFNNGGWLQCRDYTEDKQATTVNLHQLDGPALALKAELDALINENEYLKDRLL